MNWLLVVLVLLASAVALVVAGRWIRRRMLDGCPPACSPTRTSTSTGSPWTTRGLVSIPLGFLFAIVGTLTSKELDKAKWAEMEVRSLTGAHAEKAVAH